MQLDPNLLNLSPPPPTPTINTAGSVAANTPAPPPVNSNTLPPQSNDDSGTSNPSKNIETIAKANSGSSTSAEKVNEDVQEGPDQERNDSPNHQYDLGDPGTPPYPNEGFVKTSLSTSMGRRLKNPLGKLASYTYQISLYMVSPKSYESFIKSGRKNVFSPDLPEGTFLVAQSAGMGTPESRAPGFELDFYIDDLTFNHLTSTRGRGSPISSIDYRFKIIEPYGFSFVTKLQKLQDKMRDQDGKGTAQYITDKSNVNVTKNFFILGVRFYGWDQSGKQLFGDEIIDGETLDPNASGTGALFESFNEIVLTEFKFKLDGRATVYNIKAQPVSTSLSVNVTKGMVPDTKNVSGSTVREMLCGPNGLITILNNDQKKIVPKTAQYPITYKIQWLGNDAEDLAISSVIVPNKNKKSNQPGSSAGDTAESNDAQATKATPNKNKTQLSIPDSPITEAIETIISSSKFINDAMTKNYDDADQVDPDTNEPSSKKGANKRLQWFSISPNISNIRWDKKRGDWIHDIVYVIQTYPVSSVDNPYVANKANYPGPYKRYDYWYTGQNTEILSYEQKLDNMYFLAVMSDPENKDQDAEGNTKTAVNTQAGGNKTGEGGTPSKAAVNSFRTSLYDPESFASAKIQILGDPDLIMHNTAPLSGRAGVYDADGFKPNPTASELFIEIDFKEAVDYSQDGSNAMNDPGVTGGPGLMSINDSIEFWRYEDKSIYQLIKGVSYQVTQVNNKLSNGSFTQTIDAIINQDLAKDALSKEGKEDAGLNEDEKTPDKSTAASPPKEQAPNTEAAAAPGIIAANSTINQDEGRRVFEANN